MPISLNHRCIFVHIPKTGGTSIKEALNILPGVQSFSGGEVVKLLFKNKMVVTNHAPAKLISMFHPQIFSQFVKFSVVRNPYDRAISQYFYNLKKGKTNEEFSTWLRNFYSTPIAYTHCPQYDFLYDEGNCVVDNILRFESIEEDFSEFCKTYSINAKPLSKLNSSETVVNKSLLLTEENKEFIYQTFEIDFKTFNYQK
jgi:hypothetical protein